MDKVIKKLNEIKKRFKTFLVLGAKNSEFKAQKNRVSNIAKKFFGAENDYSDQMAALGNTALKSYFHKAIGIVDLMIDEIELMDAKEKKLKHPIIQQEKRELKPKVIDEINKKIFLVHGHNNAMRETIARNLEKLGLQPIILHEQVNLGDTIIEKLTRNSEVKFAIVLLSADDKGGKKDDLNDKLTLRAILLLLKKQLSFLANVSTFALIAPC